MFKKFFLLGFIVLASGCASTGEKITDYTDRSLVYAWLDIDGVDGNHMYAAGVKQYKPATDKPYWGMDIDKFEGGFLLYHYGLPKGSYKLDYVKMQSCLGFVCGNTLYTYDFGAQGDVGTAKINKPGTYYHGSYKMDEEDTGFFEQSKFSVKRTKGGPSQKQMLEHIQKKAPSGHPELDERIAQSVRMAK
jgi:hypothetical protein